MFLAEGVEVTRGEADWVASHQDLGCVKIFIILYQLQMAYTEPAGNALMVCAWQDCMKQRAKDGVREGE